MIKRNNCRININNKNNFDESMEEIKKFMHLVAK